MPRISAILILMLAAGIGVARADVYQWTDAHGELHYTDQWVPGAKLIMTTETRAPASGDRRSSGAMQGIVDEGQAATRQLRQNQEAQAVKADQAKVRAQQCRQARKQYQRMIQARRIYTTDKSGHRHYLSDAQAEAALVKARAAQDRYCGQDSAP